MDSEEQHGIKLEENPEYTPISIPPICDPPENVPDIRIMESEKNNSDITKSEIDTKSNDSLPTDLKISDISNDKFASTQVDLFLDKFIKPEYKNWKSSSLKTLKRRSSRRQISLNVLIVGEPGLGQKTFIESLVTNNTIKKGNESKISEDPGKIISDSMVERSYYLMKDGHNICLNLINVPQYGSDLQSDSTFSDILDYVNETFMDCFKLECSLDRTSTEDKKIHCCLYFISPYGHSLKLLDIEFMKLFQTKFNIIPIIPKSDNFTKTELEMFKKNILKDFEIHKIRLFDFNNSESVDNDLEDAYDLWEEVKAKIPFSIVTSNVTAVNNKKIEERIRQYPWGILKTDESENNNYSYLENILLRTHINYLKLSTKIIFYENFRMQYMLDHVN